MELVVHQSADALAGAAAEAIAGLVSSTPDRFTLGLAGGSTPAATYRRLRATPIDWERVDAWLSDERWVPPDDDRSNGRMAAELLMDHVDSTYHRPLWADHVDADDAAAHYEATIRSIHPEGRPDLVLLGLGADGHTASLFPGTDALEEDTRWYVANYVPEKGEKRLTATFPLLWRSKTVMFLVSGEPKARALRDSFQEKTPAGRVGESEGQVVWHVDAPAAALLQ